MAYNTGNPIGSIDARDLYDNAQNMDKAVNQTTARWSDRFGVSRPSWAGMSHYNNVGEYAADMLITGYNEVFRYEGEFYRAAAATVLPYTTTGSWSEDGPLFVSVGDAVLRHDMAYEADMYIGYYRNAINCNQYGGLNAAFADADTLGKTIIVTDDQALTDDIDTSGRGLVVEYGGEITTTGYGITINGPFEAGLYPVFAGSGTVTGLKESRPEWFGENTTPGTTDMSAAVSSALASLVSGGELKTLPTTYLVTNVSVKANTTISGQGTFKLKAAASLNFDPIFRITGPNIKIPGIKFNGNRDNQPADGFSDSFDGGANGTGKGNRAAILMDNDLTGYAIANVEISGCTFSEMYGASIASQSVSHVNIHDNTFHDNNFEGVMLYVSTAGDRSVDARVTNNTFTDIGSGHATVNANAIVVSYYDGAIVTGNKAKTIERNIAKFEACPEVVCSHNVIDTNTVANFNALQMQSGFGKAIISHNTLYNTGQGIKVEGGTFSDIQILNNVIHTTTGTTGDGITANTVSNLNIANNIITDVTRQGIFVYNGNNVSIKNNTVTNATPVNQIGIGYSAYSDNYSNVNVSGNTVSGFMTSLGNGGINISRNATYKITNLMIKDNIVVTGDAAYRAIHISADLVNSGVITGNICIGIINSSSYTVWVKHNVTSQVVAVESFEGRLLPAATAAPAAGVYYVGDVVYNSGVAAGEYIGWICTVAGEPGTWKGFGVIEP